MSAGREALLNDVPPTDALAERAVSALGAGQCVRGIYVREHEEDLHLVVAVRAEDLAGFWSVLDILMVNEAGALMSGWRDTDGGRRGVLESVFLMAAGPALRRVRVGVDTAGRVHETAGRDGLRRVFGEPGDEADPRGDADVLPDILAEEGRREPSAADLLVEALVRLHQIHDSTAAGTPLRAYGEMARFREAMRGLVGASLLGTASAAEWRTLDRSLGMTPIGRACRAQLLVLAEARPPGGPVDFAALLDRVLHLAELAAPEAAAELAGPRDSYRRYLGVL